MPPATTFFGEPAPALDPRAWRLRVHGGGRDTRLSLAELTALGAVDRSAVLDCTSCGTGREAADRTRGRGGGGRRAILEE